MGVFLKKKQPSITCWWNCRNCSGKRRELHDIMGNQIISVLKSLFCFKLEMLDCPKFDPLEKTAYERGSSFDVHLNSPGVPVPQLVIRGMCLELFVRQIKISVTFLESSSRAQQPLFLDFCLARHLTSILTQTFTAPSYYALLVFCLALDSKPLRMGLLLPFTLVASFFTVLAHAWCNSCTES